MRLILMRHPKPICEPGLCYGRLDLEADPEALEQAVSQFRPLAQDCIVISSPARRALGLAIRLSPRAATEVRLQELHFGDWEGERWQDIGQSPIDIWRGGLPGSAPPNGETLTSLAERCAEWLLSLDAYKGRPVLAVTHAGPIRVMRALLRREPLLTYFSASVPFAKPILLENNLVTFSPFHATGDKFDGMG